MIIIQKKKVLLEASIKTAEDLSAFWAQGESGGWSWQKFLEPEIWKCLWILTSTPLPSNCQPSPAGNPSWVAFTAGKQCYNHRQPQRNVCSFNSIHWANPVSVCSFNSKEKIDFSYLEVSYIFYMFILCMTPYRTSVVLTLLIQQEVTWSLIKQ